jgi:hypothetical protein
MISKLGSALRAKYRTPQDVLRKLGLDQDLLEGGAGEVKGLAGEHSVRIIEHLRNKLSAEDLAQLQLLLNNMFSGGVGKTEGEDTNGDWENGLVQFLKSRGLTGSELVDAMKLARGEEGVARDVLPTNAMRGGLGSRFKSRDDVVAAREAAARIEGEPGRMQAQDAARATEALRSADRVHRKFPDSARIT